MSFKVEIKEPCLENWQSMTPTEQGRFCKLCSKEVVDFTGKTRQEITNKINTAPKQLCGRFQQHQLEATYGEVKPKRIYAWAQKAAVLVGLGVVTPSIAQQTKTPTAIVERNQKRVNQHEEPKDTTKVICASNIKKEEAAKIEVAMHQTDSNYVATGQIIYDNEPLIGATVRVKDTKIGAITGLEGDFNLSLAKEEYNLPITLEFFYVGFDRQSFTIKPNEKVISYLPNNTNFSIGAVVVAGYVKRRRPRLHQRFLNLFRKRENRKW